MLQGKKIILGVSGSIAAYKSAILLRNLVKAGAEVQVIMTPSAGDFVGALTFSSLSKRPVLSNVHSEKEWNNHVELGTWADLMVIAPATANTMSKLANGIVDNLLTAVYLSARCPVVVAPAMDHDMYEHPATQLNIRRLQYMGVKVLPVGVGPLASGLTGLGRLAEPDEIHQYILEFFKYSRHLAGKKILVTAGPTYEAIDPVRFIGNHSSGKMGVSIADAAVDMGAEVYLIQGPGSVQARPNPRLHVFPINNAAEMLQQAKTLMGDMDCFILAAAVADFKPTEVAPQKIKKGNQTEFLLRLQSTDDIAAYIGKHKRPDQILCGFALETENLVENARAKKKKKKMDYIVINTPDQSSTGFGHDTNQITIIDSKDQLIGFELKPKIEVAKDILVAIFER